MEDIIQFLEDNKIKYEETPLTIYYDEMKPYLLVKLLELLKDKEVKIYSDKLVVEDTDTSDTSADSDTSDTLSPDTPSEKPSFNIDDLR